MNCDEFLLGLSRSIVVPSETTNIEINTYKILLALDGQYHGVTFVDPCLLKAKQAERDALQERLQGLLQKQKQLEATAVGTSMPSMPTDTSSKYPPAPKQAAQPPAPNKVDPKQPAKLTVATNVSGKAPAVAASGVVTGSSGNSPTVGKAPPSTPPKSVRRKLFHSPQPAAAEAVEVPPAFEHRGFVNPRLAKKFDIEPDRCPYSTSDLRLSGDEDEDTSGRPVAAPLRHRLDQPESGCNGEGSDTKANATVMDSDGSPNVTCLWIGILHCVATVFTNIQS